jgi:hypothetical protein
MHTARTSFLLLAAALSVEFAFFCAVILPRQAWVYPRWYDQVQYLADLYRDYEVSRTHGVLAAFKGALLNDVPQGTLQRVVGLPLLECFGPSRSSVIALNLLGFLALQAATFWAVRTLLRSEGLAWASAGLLLALACPWSGEVASVVDCRLDWLAACGYGITLCATLRAAAGGSQRWAVLAGLAVGLEILTRTLTSVYFVLIFAGLAFLPGPGQGRRLRLLLSLAVAAAIAFPVLWLRRQAIYDYYWVGQFVGPERAFRDAHLGLVRSTLWVLGTLCFRDVGLAAFALAAGVLVLLGAGPRGSPGRVAENPPARRPGALRVALAFALAPLVVLVLHPAKTAQPASIAVAPVVWLLVLAWERRVPGTTDRAQAWIGGGAFAAGFLVFASMARGHVASAEDRADTAKLNALVDYVYYRSEESDLRQPRLGVTLVSAALNVTAFRVMGYERHRVPLDVQTPWPLSPSQDAVRPPSEELGTSDFVLLMRGADLSLPFNRASMAHYAQAKTWCDGKLRHQVDLEVLGLSVSVYERPTLPSADGLTSLPGLLAGATAGVESGRPTPPAKPRFVAEARYLLGANEPCSFRIRAAYSPATYSAVGLPEGLSLDSRSGILCGRVRQTGVFRGRVGAVNAIGSSTADLVLTVREGAFVASADSPSSVPSGVPVDIRFEAFDRDEHLDFVDITRLGAGQGVVRLPAAAADHQVWSDAYRVLFAQAGRQTLNLRFVRFDPRSSPAYSFVDVVCPITVTEPPP